MDEFILTSLMLGLVLGLSHAFDPDHLIAVGTLAAESESVQRSSELGMSWGLGHTVTLAGVGGVLLGLKWRISETMATGLEFLVAVMIIALGASVLWKAVQSFSMHKHTHTHDDKTHTHIHLHVKDDMESHHHHVWASRRKAFAVGIVHGIAGSATLSLAVMTTMPSTSMGMLYILLFGVGSIGGMVLMSALLSVPFVWTGNRLAAWHSRIKVCAGVGAMCFGASFLWFILW